jgi:ABC-type transport system involved in multi-copper enzyme maturation permease subunit
MTLVGHLYRRLMRKGRVIALIALASVPGLVVWLVSFDTPEDRRDVIYPEVVSSAGYSFAIAVLILTVATLRDERDAGTLPFIYMRPIPRAVFSVSSIVAGAFAALTVAVGGWLASLVAALAVGMDPAVPIAGLSLFVSAAIGYTAVFVPLGYLVPRALLVGLGYIVVVESILASAVDGLAHISIWRIAVSIYADLAPEFPADTARIVLGTVAPGVAGGVIKLAVVLLLGWGVLTWALRRRDAV